MNKQQLIETIAGHCGESKATVDRVISSMTTTIGDALAAGDEVNLPGIGKFVVVDRKARTVNSPMTGGKRDIPASRTAKLRVAKPLKDSLN